MNQIPVIDIAPAINGEDPAAVAANVYDAIINVGFFQVIGHGIPLALIDAAYGQFDDLFARPSAEKDQWRSPTGNPFRGYSRQLKGVNDGAIIESYEVASISSPEEAIGKGVDPAFADYFDTYTWADIDATRSLGETMMSLFARALGMAPGYFDPMLKNDVSNFACKYYSADRQLEEQRVLLGEHGDSGMLTLLHQRGTYEGLQVLLRNGERITVPVREDAYVVNVGQLMTRWTNNLFPATPHRVITPPTAADSRKSIVMFHLPAVNTVIQPLSPCVGQEGPYYRPTTPYVEQAKATERSASLERV
jgi:isopenicillin N synthase-like dioxygenase